MCSQFSWQVLYLFLFFVILSDNILNVHEYFFHILTLPFSWLCCQGFSDFLFKMYLDEGNLQQLLSLSKDFPSELTLFLESHPHLAWLHHLATQDYAAVNTESKGRAVGIVLTCSYINLCSRESISSFSVFGAGGDFEKKNEVMG